MNRREWLGHDFYAVLGVGPAATQQQIKSAYRSLARRHHPDLNPSDSRSEERFKRVLQAYSVLSDQSQRTLYDRVRSGRPVAPIVRPGGFARFRVNIEAMRPMAPPPVRGNDLEAEVVLSHREARRGRLVRLQCRDPRRPTRTAIVFLRPGIRDGERLHLKGKGGFGSNGGGFGDLYLNVMVLPSRPFWRTSLGDPGRRPWDDGIAALGAAGVVRAALKVLLRSSDL